MSILSRLTDVEKGPGAAKLEALKQRMMAERVVNFFKSPDDLRAQVINSLSKVSPTQSHDNTAGADSAGQLRALVPSRSTAVWPQAAVASPSAVTSMVT